MIVCGRPETLYSIICFFDCVVRIIVRKYIHLAMRTHHIVRDMDFGDLLERLFVAAVLAVLTIRLFLYLTGYPQLGGNGLHIAHMLWGGFLMLAAIVILLTSLNRSLKWFSAAVAGFGFGTFIDELGKFITSDNNYFYKPTVAIIYIIFILLFLTFRALRKYGSFSGTEYLVNSIELLKEAAMGRLNVEDRIRLARYISRADKESEISKAVAGLCSQLHEVPAGAPGIVMRMSTYLKRRYVQLVQQRWFARAVTAFFILQAVLSFLFLAMVIVLLRTDYLSHIILSRLRGLNLTEVVSLLASGASGMLVVLGVLRMRRARLEAYMLFRRAMLVSIFLVQVFAFYQHQMSAFFGLVWNVTILVTLDYMIEEEKAMDGDGSPYSPASQ